MTTVTATRHLNYEAIEKAGRPAGAFAWYSRNGVPEPAGLFFSCPGCRHVISCRVGSNGWEWDGDQDRPTLKPSIRHLDKRCGWHGYLTAGEFRPC